MLRTSLAFQSPLCRDLDCIIGDLLSDILNVGLEGVKGEQASLPVRHGGLGVRRVSDIAPSAFLASMASSSQLMLTLLPASCPSSSNADTALALQCWNQLGAATPPAGEDSNRQRAWDDLICKATFNRIFVLSDQSAQARLLAVSAPDSGAWVQTLPSRNLGLHLTDREIRVAVGLRLGASLVTPHPCGSCGSLVDSQGMHGLTCKSSAGRIRRHALANDVLVRSLRKAEIEADLEPRNLVPNSELRPDGVSRVKWSRGKSLAWDFTCPDTLASSHLPLTSVQAGAAAAKAEANKRQKYSSLEQTGEYIFYPIAIESLGPWGESAKEFCCELGARLARVSGDARSLTFLKQRISLAIQRGNAIAVLNTLKARAATSDS